MIPFKIFIQILLALNVSTDPAVDQHLCAAARDAKNYQENLKTCDTLGMDIDCREVMERKCGYGSN